MMKYLMEEDSCENAFAQFGTLMHNILRQYLEGTLEIWDMVSLFRERYYIDVVNSFPETNQCDLSQKYFQKGIDYCSSFEGFDNMGEVVGVEQECKMEIGGRQWKGILDVVFDDGHGLIIMDHKSKNGFKSKKEEDQYFRQLYLYSCMIKHYYGEWPYRLCLNLFQKHNIVTRNFQKDQMDDSLDWYMKNVNSIYLDSKFLPRKSYFYCHNLCGMRYVCDETI